MPPITLLIKPSSGMCNLSCHYCFYHDIAQKRIQESYGFMSEETIAHVIEKALIYADECCTIGFQGGEPTLIGLEFYKKVVQLEQLYNTKKVKIQNLIQTNGYKLTCDWAAFFAEHNFLVGLSIDGTIHTHNHYRKTAIGEDTFTDIMQTAELFSQYKVEYNILTVVNSRTAASIQKIYKYYHKMQFHYLQFIPCLDPFGMPPGAEEYSLLPDIYGKFLCELFDLWYDDIIHGKPVYIRQFENYVSMLHGYPAESCDMNGFCSNQYVIESDGEVYPCDFFVLDPYQLGNLNTNTIEEINQKRAEIGFIEESIITNKACKACPCYYLCRGGCKRHRLLEGHTNYQTNYFCKSYQIFFAHSKDRLIELARRFQP